MVNRTICLSAVCVLAAVLAGCKTKTAPIGNATGEQSVAPGVNAAYQVQDLDVREWVSRFEKEEREVYAMRKEIVRASRIWLNSTVADIGAGTGAFTKLLSDAVGPGGKVYAVDVVPEFLLHLKQRIADEGIPNVDTVLCGERSVDLPPNSVDLAFLCDTYHHFEYPRATLRSIHKAMRPGGRLVVVDFKRIENVSSEWIMEHVRAGQEQVTAEIEAAGFTKIKDANFLRENYFMMFRRLER